MSLWSVHAVIFNNLLDSVCREGYSVTFLVNGAKHAVAQKRLEITVLEYSVSMVWQFFKLTFGRISSKMNFAVVET